MRARCLFHWANPPRMAGAGFEPALDVFAIKFSLNVSFYSSAYSSAKLPKKQARLAEEIMEDGCAQFLFANISIIRLFTCELDRLL